MLSDQLSETTPLILSRPERSGVWQWIAESRHGGSWACCNGEFVQPC